MSDFKPVTDYVARFIQLTEEEEEYFVSLLRLTHVRKKQFIVQPDFVCQYRSYVVKGALRGYLIGNDGEEHTISIAIEDWWISDFTSFINQEPAILYVEALEDSTLIQLSYSNEQLLLERIPKFERYFRITSQRAGAAIQRRMLSSLSKTAEERYNELAAKYPKFLQRIPQYILASYLGMTTQFLSKIRNQKAKS